jgi:Mrp family chromosome partitioning ATPase
VDIKFNHTGPFRAVQFTEPKPMSTAFEPWLEAPPPIDIAPEMITYHQPDHAASQEYAALLSTLREGLKMGPPLVMMMVGIKAHIGTTTVLLNLAGVAARQQQSIAVIDVSGRKPGLAQRLGCNTTTGLEEVIDGAMGLDQALVQTAIPGLRLLTAGAPSKKQSAVTLEAMAWLMPVIRQRFDLVLIDGPPLEHTEELAVHVPHAHGTFLVLPHDEPAVPFKGIAKAIGRLGGRLSGMVHTHFEG